MAKKKRKKVPKKEIKEAEKKLKEELKKQTEEELRQKCKDLASIIEEMSGEMEPISESQIENVIEPKIKEMDEKFQANIQELKGLIENLGKKIEKPTKIKGDITPLINEINEKLEPRLTGLEEKIESLSSIEDLENKIKSLTGESKKGGEAPPKKMSILEEKIIQTMQDEIISIKESLQSISNEINVFTEKTDKKMQKFFQHLDPETVKKLEELIAYLDKTVPSKVRNEVGNKLKPIFDHLRHLRNFTDDLEKRLNKISKEVKEDKDKIDSLLELKHELKGSIIDLEIDKERLTKIIEESNKKSEKADLNLESEFKSQIDTLNNRFVDFEQVLNDYTKIMQDRVNKMLSEFSGDNLSKIEKKYYNALSSTQQSIKSLESQLNKFTDFANSNFASLKENMEAFNLRLEKFKELEKQEHLKLDNKMDSQKSDVKNTLNEYPKFIKDEVNQLFSSLTEEKLSELEKRYHNYLSEINENAKTIQSNLSKFQKTFNSTLPSFDSRIKTITSEIEKVKEKDKEIHSKLNKKITLDIAKLEDMVKEHSTNMENNVNELLNDLTKAKTTEIDNKFEEIVNEINEKSKVLSSQFLEFKDKITSSLSSLSADTKNLDSHLKKIKEKQIEFASKNEINKINEKFKKVIQEAGTILSTKKEIEKNVYESMLDDLNQKMALFDSKISGLKEDINSITNMVKKELDKKLTADKIKFEEILGKIINEKKSLEKLLNEQNEKINSIVEELGT